MTSAQWQALINADPGLNLITGQLSSGDVSNLGQRNAEIQQALVSFGGPVDLNQIASKLGLSANDLQGLDSATIQQLAQQADQSGVSTSARLNQANATAVAGIKNALAARGLLHSSELNNELNTQNQNFTNAQFDARSKLLSALQQYQQGYLAYKAQMAQQLAQAINDAANRAVSQYGGQTQPNGPDVGGGTPQPTSGYLPGGTPGSAPAVQPGGPGTAAINGATVGYYDPMRSTYVTTPVTEAATARRNVRTLGLV